MSRLRKHSVEELVVSAYRVPTEAPESDGTLTWDATTMVVVEACAQGVRGLGYTYGHEAVATLIQGRLAQIVRGQDPMDVPGLWAAMGRATRNLGTRGLVAMAVSAVDTALWDLKARLLEVPLAALWGRVRPSAPVYGSGGFTSLSISELERQLAGWVSAGIPRVKMKVGRDPGTDPERVRAARQAIGPDAELFVDANGAYTPAQAVRMAERFAEHGVTWLEEPVSSDDLDGLRRVRARAPAGMAVSAGEYGYDVFDFRRMLEAGAVDVMQADVTRCKGFSGFVQADVLSQSFCVPLSAHTAPALHAHLGVAMPALVHLEYFHDHTRIESMFLDGLPALAGGALHVDEYRPGNGLSLRRKEAANYAL